MSARDLAGTSDGKSYADGGGAGNPGLSSVHAQKNDYVSPQSRDTEKKNRKTLSPDVPDQSITVNFQGRDRAPLGAKI